MARLDIALGCGRERARVATARDDDMPRCMVGWLKRLLGGNDDGAGEKEATVYYAPLDGDMDAACAQARETFKYFWREMCWEQRRIVKACEVASVKAPFADDGDVRGGRVEHLWLANVDFDGRRITGEVLNAPDRLRSVRRGDGAELPLDRISDWMYTIRGRVCGAFTVGVIRRSMDPGSLADHDAAWGLDFGPPGQILLVPRGDGWSEPDTEHPMSVNMSRAYPGGAEGAHIATARDHRGWTQLHHHALAGNLAMVDALLAAGADPSATTPEGDTAATLAERIAWWPGVIERLRAVSSS
jgi:uncharacterized protein YegJ (DUF2314 family)